MKLAYRSTALSVIAALTLSACGSEITHVAARPPRVQSFDYARLAGRHPSSRALARALDLRLRLNPMSKTPQHVKHCRLSLVGCRERIAAMSRALTESSLNAGVDPFLTAAIAIVETKLNPDAVSRVGARGIMQLNPRYIGKDSRFVRDESYRQACSKTPDNCQKEVIDKGLELLKWAQVRCDGSMQQALGLYNTGKCINNYYARDVLRERRQLLRLAKATYLEADNIFSDHYMPPVQVAALESAKIY